MKSLANLGLRMQIKCDISKVTNLLQILRQGCLLVAITHVLVVPATTIALQIFPCSDLQTKIP